jgi:hypothetical protein
MAIRKMLDGDNGLPESVWCRMTRKRSAELTRLADECGCDLVFTMAEWAWGREILLRKPLQRFVTGSPRIGS